MSEENEFSRYMLLYQELKERVARIGDAHREAEELRARMAALERQMRELAPDHAAPGETEIGWQTRRCPVCGQAYETPLDEPLCPECGEGAEGPPAS